MKNIFKNFFLFALVLFSHKMVGQNQNVVGTITDSQNTALPGVSIVEKGTSNGVSSDFDGKYTINVSGPSAVLVFSSIGFAEQEIRVGQSSKINILLAEDSAVLDEVVVVGYGTQRRQDLTGAIVSADLKQFQESPNTNILQALQGSLPGITIGQTTTAGAEPSIQIRGQSTLGGNQSPLIVVDGAIYRGRLSDLNPKDIKSVDVLKDPSSKAIYGAQAANGIVIVTTKTAKTGQKPIVNYSTFYAIQNPTNSRRTLNRDEYLEAARDVDWQNGYSAPNFTTINPAWSIGNDTAFFPPLVEGLANGTDFDWFNALTNPGFIKDHQLSISGSSEKTSYYLSAGLTDQEGWVINDNFKRQTVRLNMDTKVTDWLTVGANIFGAFSDFSGQSPSLPSIPPMSPLTQPRDGNGDLIINPLGTFLVNPFLQTTADDRDNQNNISALFYASIKVPQIPGLNFRVNYSNNYRWSLRGNSNTFGAGLTGSAFKSNSSTHDVLLDNILTYDIRLGAEEQHGLKATLVAGFNTIESESTSANASGFSNLNLSFNSLEQGIIPRTSSSAWEENYNNQTARINYDFKSKYLLNASIRRDGFSGFAANNKIAYFPSVGFGWILSEEGFLKNATAIDILKFRGSYGSNGNLTARYSSLARLEAGADSQYLFGDGGTTVVGQTLSSLANNSLSWEKTNGVNLGLEFGFLKNKISGSIDYYSSTTNDLLFNVRLPQITGFRQIISNVGEIRNNGIEVVLDFNPIRTDNFNWDFGLNFARNDNKIIALTGQDNDGDGIEDDLVASGLFIGESIGSIFSYTIDGIYQIGDTDIPTGYAPGQYRIRDLNGDGNITPEDDRSIIGREEPAYQFGIKNSMTYKNFTFNFFVNSIQGGNDGYIRSNDPWSDANGSYGTLTLAQSSNRFSDINYWTPRNPNAEYVVPGISVPIPATPFQDRSFIRLQDISLSYNLDSAILKKIGFQNFKLFVSGKNLITITNWDGWDPETGLGLQASFRNPNGSIAGGLPAMKSYTLGLDISF
jgi:TonB-linked SusC/RagA family outer membrane protein